MFPKLLITTYSFVQKYCMEDPAFTSGLPMTVHQSRLHGHPPHPQTRTVQPATVVTSRAGICEPRQEMLDAARSTSNLNPDAACWSGAQVTFQCIRSVRGGNICTLLELVLLTVQRVPLNRPFCCAAATPVQMLLLC